MFWYKPHSAAIIAILVNIQSQIGYNSRMRKKSALALAIFLLTATITFALIFRHNNPRFAPSTTPEKLLSSATLGGDYLVRSIDDSGYFIYEYDPETDKVSDSYNMLRHAGTVYAMLELYEQTQNPELLASARKGLLFLLENIKSCHLNEQEYLCLIDEEGDVKLGGNALAIIAMTKYAEIMGTDDDYWLAGKTLEETSIDTSHSLANWIVASQASDGEFTAHKTNPEGTYSSTFVSEYYPGEAILALLRLQAIAPADEEDKYLDAAERGADWLIQVRDKNKNIDNIAHDHWLLYGLNELYRLRPNKIYLKHAWKIVDAIEKLQDEEGGFYNPPRSTPTATRSEALVSAYKLAVYSKTNSKTDQILKILDRAIAFELRTQITDKDSRAFGGFGESLTDSTVRIDFVQHNISALLGYREILEKINE